MMQTAEKVKDEEDGEVGSVWIFGPCGGTRRIRGRPRRLLHINLTGSKKFVESGETGSVKFEEDNVTGSVKFCEEQRDGFSNFRGGNVIFFSVKTSVVGSVNFVKDSATGSGKFVQDKLINSLRARNCTHARTERERAQI